jgi:hypothetical protein
MGGKGGVIFSVGEDEVRPFIACPVFCEANLGFAEHKKTALFVFSPCFPVACLVCYPEFKG